MMLKKLLPIALLLPLSAQASLVKSVHSDLSEECFKIRQNIHQLSYKQDPIHTHAFCYGGLQDGSSNLDIACFSILNDNADFAKAYINKSLVNLASTENLGCNNEDEIIQEKEKIMNLLAKLD